MIGLKKQAKVSPFNLAVQPVMLSLKSVVHKIEIRPNVT